MQALITVIPDTTLFMKTLRSAQVVRGGESVCFTVTFVSDRPARHAGYLRGVQRVFSPEVPLALKLWPSGGSACVGIDAAYGRMQSSM